MDIISVSQRMGVVEQGVICPDHANVIYQIDIEESFTNLV